nr:hypothetical protein Iba_chr15aCG4170 [Ipomoea batatas]
MERSWFQRPRLLKACSRSSASESCEAIETSEFDEMLSICSREAILDILALGDIEDALKQMQINMLRPCLLFNLVLQLDLVEELHHSFVFALRDEPGSPVSS